MCEHVFERQLEAASGDQRLVVATLYDKVKKYAFIKIGHKCRPIKNKKEENLMELGKENYSQCDAIFYQLNSVEKILQQHKVVSIDLFWFCFRSFS